MGSRRALSSLAFALFVPLTYLSARWLLRRLRPAPRATGPPADAASPPTAKAPASSSGSSSSHTDQRPHLPQPRAARPSARSKSLAKVLDVKQALEATGGDTHIVDDAEDWEVLEVLGMGTFGQAELRRSFDPEFSDDFVVIKRVPVKSLSDWAVGALMSELVNGMAMHHQHIAVSYTHLTLPTILLV